MAPWTEWQERCAIARCTDETRQTLETFGGMRFRTLAQRCLPLINVRDIKDVMLPDTDAWHLLESHMTIPQSANAKAYKQWLFARIEGSHDCAFDIIQGGATLLMRSVVREHLRNEFSPASHRSLNQPVNPDTPPSSVTEEWLAGESDTRDTVARRELTAIASREASNRFAQLNTRTRLALAARYLRVPLSSPTLLVLAACKKSAMHTAFHTFASTLLKTLQSTYAGEDHATVKELGLLTFEALTDRCVEWADATNDYGERLRAEAPASTEQRSRT